jgi:putative DNA methylase
MTARTSVTPRVLAEDWLPIAELGVESRRERAAPSALPPLSFLHVWWARRPLVASTAVVLAGLLPAWTDDLADGLPDVKQVSDESTYRKWLLHLVGIWGDPVQARKAIDIANAEGRKLDGNGYGYKQAFRNHPDRNDVDVLRAVLRRTWGNDPLVADLTAGGGSIPFAATRLGIRAFANDLNGVATAVLRGGVEYPAEHGVALIDDLKVWGERLVGRVTERLAPFFPLMAGEQVIAYIWAHAVTCPRTGKTVPLVPDWSLRSDGGKEVAVRLVTKRNGRDLNEPEFELAEGGEIDFDPKRGTVRRGDGLSPWDGQVIDESYIKSEAQAGRMSAVLYAVAVRTPGGKREFRVPSATDLAALQEAGVSLKEQTIQWGAGDILPTEELAEKGDRGRTSRPRLFGINSFSQMFTERQLLAHGIFVEEFRTLIPEVQRALPAAKAKAVLTLLGLMQGTALTYNAKLARWNTPRQTITQVFQRHDFSFKWSFAEFEGVALFKWALGQLLDSYGSLARLLNNTGFGPSGEVLDREVTVARGNAADMRDLVDGSVTHLCMDPPYYDNVMYAELSDFFYVWEKRTIGRVAPEFFPTEMADADNEAVANASRFAHMGRRMRELADTDYEAKMTAIFAEAYRVLRDDGVLTVMFTHKRAEAWDTLGMGLLQAGFAIETSWPVNTEFENSLHQSGVNSAASTIMLVCRKRPTARPIERRVYREDIEAEVRDTARRAVEQFRRDGIDGVDLLLSAYGPALGVVSRHWPVYSSTADESGRAQLLRPEDALAAARAEIVRVQRARLVGHPAEFDALTDFTIAFWDTFKGPTTTFDDARRLALAVGGLDVDYLARAKIIEKKAGTVTLQAPSERLRIRGADADLPGVRIDAEAFPHLIDAIHTACLIADEDGLGRARMFLERTGLGKDSRFGTAVQALVNAVPRTKVKGEFVLPLAQNLDRMVTFCLPDVDLPADAADPDEQLDLFSRITE